MKTILFALLLTISTQAKIKMAITVDDLPAHGKMPTGMTRLQASEKMLYAFKAYGVPEVYGFLNAGKLTGDPDLAAATKAWVDADYPLGNHTFTHKSINKVSIVVFKKEFDNIEKALQEYSGKHDWKVFRYPFLYEGNELEKRNEIRKHLAEKGYKIAQVTVDFEDWGWNEPYARCLDKKDTKQIKWLKSTFLANAKDHLHRAEKLSSFLFQRSIPHILLLHVGAMDADLLDELLKMYKKEGVAFISLSEAMKDPVYSIDPGIVAEWGSELTYQILKSKNLKVKDAGLEPYTKYPKKKLETICTTRKVALNSKVKEVKYGN